MDPALSFPNLSVKSPQGLETRSLGMALLRNALIQGNILLHVHSAARPWNRNSPARRAPDSQNVPTCATYSGQELPTNPAQGGISVQLFGVGFIGFGLPRPELQAPAFIPSSPRGSILSGWVPRDGKRARRTELPAQVPCVWHSPSSLHSLSVPAALPAWGHGQCHAGGGLATSLCSQTKLAPLWSSLAL